MSQLKCSKIIGAPRQSVFDYMLNPEKWPEQLAEDIEVEVTVAPQDLEAGNRYKMNMTRYGLSQPVEIIVLECRNSVSVTYKQVHGLFSKWIHTQKFEDADEGHTLVTDVVEYQLPFGLFGHLLDDLLIREDMKKILEHRQNKVNQHFEI